MMNRLLKLKKLLREQKVDAILVSSVPTITYLTGFSHFSVLEREAYLLITKNNQYIITDGRYSEAVSLQVKGWELIERSSTNSLKQIFTLLGKKHKVKTLGIAEDNLTVFEYKFLKKIIPTLKHVSLEQLQIIKEPAEISAIEKACALGDKTFMHILSKIKTGVGEKELAFEIELFFKKHNGDISFPTIVAFGSNSSMPHHQTGDRKLKKNEFVLLDFGVKLHNYCSDMTRTVFFGKPTKEQEKMYQTVLDAQQKTINQLELRSKNHESRIKASEVDNVAREYIMQQGYPTIPHSLGHGIGLEVHEAPSLSPSTKDELKAGMVFSVEPGIYQPGIGGVRIEDLVVLEKKGPRLLTKAQRELIVL